MLGVFGMLVFALIEGRSYGWWEATDSAPVSLGEFSIIPVLFVLSVIVLGALVFRERSRVGAGKSVLLDVRLFRIPTFSNGNVTALTVSLGEFGLILSLPLWFQYVLGMDALQAGLALLPLAIGSFVASGAVRPLSKYLSPVRMVRLGIALEIISLAVMALLIRPDSSTWVTGVPLFFYGMGVGFATAQLTQLILADVPLDASGQASSTQSTARQVGSALGIAILGTALFSTLRAGTEARLSDEIKVQRPTVRAVEHERNKAIAHNAQVQGPGQMLPTWADLDRAVRVGVGLLDLLSLVVPSVLLVVQREPIVTGGAHRSAIATEALLRRAGVVQAGAPARPPAVLSPFPP